MKLILISRNWTAATFTVGIVFAGLVTVSAQQQGRGGRQFDPAQIMELMQQRGMDPNQLLERAQQAGIDTTQLLNRARQAGIDPTQFGNASGQTGAGAALQLGAGNRNLFDPSQILERTVDGYQEQLEFSDEEWAVVRPLVKDVIEKRNALQAESNPVTLLASLGGGRGAGGLARGGATTRSNAEPNPEEVALRSAIDSSAAAAEVKAKLEEFRAMKKKQADELKTAREKLRKVLNVRREAKAVLAGLLE